MYYPNGHLCPMPNSEKTYKNTNAMKTHSLLIAAVGLLLSMPLPLHAQPTQEPVSLADLRTEALHNPLGLDTETPRFSWQLQSDESNVMQRTYRIMVASDSSKLADGECDLWDSGIVTSDSSLWVAYRGMPLGSNRHAYWKVQITASYGKDKECQTSWSPIAKFSTGLLSENRWKGQWIGLDQAMPWDREEMHSRLSARYLRTEFTTDKPIKRATAFIAGLGLYEFYINGQKVGNEVLTPAPTDYRKTILYNTYDVTALIQSQNAIGVVLGNGRYYTMCQNYKPYKIANFGYPKLRLNLVIEYVDGSRETIASDTRWKLTPDGPIRSNNEYDGEIYDARKELGAWTQPGYNDSTWIPAQRVSIPTGTLRGAMMPGMKIWQEIKPVSVIETEKGFILDFGQNMAGWVEMKVQGQAGDSIFLQYAERLNKDGKSLFTENLRDALSTDTYICNGEEDENEKWAPIFSYHGFRYVEVSGYKNLSGTSKLSARHPLTECFTAQVISDDMEETGTFSSSDKTLNAIVKNARWGILGNYKGMPVDCPQRNERQPWLGDRTKGCWGESYLFGNERLYTKWVRDICEAQREDGCIPDVAPAFWNYYSDNVTWPSALIFACEMIYTQYGNMEPIRKHYSSMQRWIEHMAKEYTNRAGLIVKDKYGDWCVPPESPEMIHSQDPARKTDGRLIASAYFYKDLKIMAGFARLLGMSADAERYDADAEKLKAAFNRIFLTVQPATGKGDSVAFYANNTVTANLLPLAFDMIPAPYAEAVAKNLSTTIIETHNAHISCGVIGMQWLFGQLCRIGQSNLAYQMASHTSYPSFGYMIENGATTIWELWNGDTANPWMNSGNHVMLLGDFLPFCFEELGGIRPSTDKVGFKHIIFKPCFDIKQLDHVDVTYQTPYGQVESRWKKSRAHIVWDIMLPPNTTAEVHLPNGEIRQIGSGAYHYRTSISK